MNNPYAAPKAPVNDPEAVNADDVNYVGFWLRFVASFIDSILSLFIVVPVLLWVYRDDSFLELAQSGGFGAAYYLIVYGLPAIAVILFWIARQATPGKMALSMRIVDASTFGKISTGQAIGRYLSYYLSAIPLMLGFIWAAFDGRKQGWHDKLAGTVVVRTR
jgi:uncharacterized RDD family membrane protein YckC